MRHSRSPKPAVYVVNESELSSHALHPVFTLCEFDGAGNGALGWGQTTRRERRGGRFRPQWRCQRYAKINVVDNYFN
jgi:hypothetical protein